MAIVQTMVAINSGKNRAAVVDLKSAHDCVPPDKLMAICDRPLPKEMTLMMTRLVQTLTVKTVGNRIITTGKTT